METEKKNLGDYIWHASSKIVNRTQVALAEVTQTADKNAEMHIQFTHSRRQCFPTSNERMKMKKIQ